MKKTAYGDDGNESTKPVNKTPRTKDDAAELLSKTDVVRKMFKALREKYGAYAALGEEIANDHRKLGEVMDDLGLDNYVDNEHSAVVTIEDGEELEYDKAGLFQSLPSPDFIRLVDINPAKFEMLASVMPTIKRHCKLIPIEEPRLKIRYFPKKG